MVMRRYLLVVDMGWPTMGEEHDLEPITYLVARQEQEPCEAVVLSLARNRPEPPAGLRAGAGLPQHPDPAHQADDGTSVDARHRMDRAVQHLKNIGCPATGIVSHDDPATAVRAETSARHYDEVILATGRPEVSRLSRIAGRDPLHQLRRALGDRLIVFPPPPS
jgi:hypothetical protein